MDESWKSDLKQWLAPFIGALRHKTRARMCPAYFAGLIGAGDRKSVQPMAARDGDVGYDQIHRFIASGIWDTAPLEKALLAEADRDGRRRRCLVDRRRHGLAKEGRALGRCRAAIRLVSWKDRQLPVAGLAHLGVAGSSGDGGAAPLPAGELDRRSRAHGSDARATGQAGRAEQAGNRDRRDRPRHPFRRALRLRPCRFRLRLQRTFPTGPERARSAVSGGSVPAPKRLPRRRRSRFPSCEGGEAPQMTHPGAARRLRRRGVIRREMAKGQLAPGNERPTDMSLRGSPRSGRRWP